jgi:hypothetical protein
MEVEAEQVALTAGGMCQVPDAVRGNSPSFKKVVKAEDYIGWIPWLPDMPAETTTPADMAEWLSWQMVMCDTLVTAGESLEKCNAETETAPKSTELQMEIRAATLSEVLGKLNLNDLASKAISYVATDNYCHAADVTVELKDVVKANYGEILKLMLNAGYGAVFRPGIYARGCQMIPRLFA